MKNFIKGFRFTPSNYPAEVEAKIQKYRKQGYKLPPRKVLRTPEQLEGIRESAKINTALLDYISENIREGMSTEEIDVLVYDFTTSHGAILHCESSWRLNRSSATSTLKRNLCCIQHC